MVRALCRRAGLLWTAALLAACASYSPLPLGSGGHLKPDVGALEHGEVPLPARLGPDDIGLLALRNNPDLRGARNKRGVAQAQLLAAGVLPNPSVNASYGFLIAGPGTIDAIGAGLTQDVRALITLPARRDAARAEQREVDASLEWDEWQVVGKARLLAVDLIEGERARGLLLAGTQRAQERLSRSEAALRTADVRVSDVVADGAAFTDVQHQLDDLARQQATRQQELRALLGLVPAAELPLADHIEIAAVDPAAVRDLLPQLANRRPDLVALQLGYRAQEARVRGAVLAQFPALSLGAAYGRDTSDIHTLGPQVTLDLPIFDRNQGAIAVETATREQLHDEFGSRVDAARSEVLGMLADLDRLQQQLAARRPRLAAVDSAADSAEHAWRRGDLDERGYVDALATRDTRHLEIIATEQSILEQQVAIATLTGAGLPAVALPPPEAP